MRRHVLSCLLLVALGACSTQASPGDGFILRDGAIDGPNRLTTDETGTILVSNEGEYSHTLVVTDEHGAVLGATGLVGSGAMASLDLDLTPGTYVFSCRIVAQDDEGNLIDHYEQGMHRTVTVRG